MSVFVVDSYGEENGNAVFYLYSGNYIKCGQSFIGKAGNLVNVKFYLSKNGNPTGNIVAKLYAHSGNFGITSIPIGAALATSDNIDISTISALNYELITFSFTGAEQYTLVEGTKYCIAIEYSGGDSSNCLNVKFDYFTAEHNGNLSYYDGSWHYDNSVDLIFYVYAEGTETEATDEIKSIKHPLLLKTDKTVNGPWTAKMQIKLDDYIQSESYIKFQVGEDESGNAINEEYIVKKLKKISDDGKIYFDCDLYHIMSELSTQSIERFYIWDTVENHLAYILAGTNWTAGTCDVSATVLMDTRKRIYCLDALYQLAVLCGGELDFDSENRTVDLKTEIGIASKIQIRCDKNCDYMEREENSIDLITRTYPYGPDGMTINTIQLQACDDKDEWSYSGGASGINVQIQKIEGTGCIDFIHSDGETMTIDLGVGGVLDLSGKDTLVFWVYDATGLGLDFDSSPCYIGIGEAAWDDNKFTLTGTVNPNSWRRIEVDISGVADADKNAIRYVGFEGGGEELYIDDIKAVGTIYIDSVNRPLYKVPKDYIYFHTSEIRTTQKTIDIFMSADARVYQGTPNTNYGTTANLAVRNEALYSELSFVKPDLSKIPSNAVVTEALLKMYVPQVRSGYGGDDVDISLADADWNESTIVYNNMPAAGASVGSVDMTSTGWKELDITDEVNDWINGIESNYGLRLEMTGVQTEKGVWINSREASQYPIKIQVTYTMSENSTQFMEDDAREFQSKNEEPALKYSANIADLSKANAITWKDEKVDLGYTARLYDGTLGINVDCRIKRIVRNLLDARDIQIELVNRTYDIADKQAALEKQLKAAMPFEDNKNIVDAGSIREGFFGGNVG